MATYISKNFMLEELCASATAKAKGIRNNPGQTDVVNLCALVHQVLPLLEQYHLPGMIGPKIQIETKLQNGSNLLEV